jgi:Na+/alanine symporter
MERVNEFVNALNNILFSNYVVYALLLTGVLFTVWSGFGQYRALTHGIRVIRGKYDDPADPGAINHFQALSAALSATVGLGNIAGVAVAIGLGGPGAVLWMWVIGVVGMALKLTEVTQSMLHRNTDDPDNPHGGPMFVVKKGLAQATRDGRRGFAITAGLLFGAVAIGCGIISGNMIALIGFSIVGVAFAAMGFFNAAALGATVGGIFVVTLITSAITGGNMFQAWNVADVTHTYFKIPQIATGIVLATMVGLVIIGGIKRIGAVAGRLVPFMCAIYVVAALYVLALNAGAIPGMLAMIVKAGLPEWLGGSAVSPTGAFVGGVFGYAALWGVKRALFSSEAGQGSAPIAHSAAKTDEPVREGVVAGLEPFIDTIVVCTMTALVILSSGAWNRGPEATTQQQPDLVNPVRIVLQQERQGAMARLGLVDRTIARTGLLVDETEDGVTLLLSGAGSTENPIRHFPTSELNLEKTTGLRSAEIERIEKANAKIEEANAKLEEGKAPQPRVPLDRLVDPPSPLYVNIVDQWVPDRSLLPARTADAERVSGRWEPGDTLFLLVDTGAAGDTGFSISRLSGTVREQVDPPATADGEQQRSLVVSWGSFASNQKPRWAEATGPPEEGARLEIFGDYAGASLTAHAFDRATPGLGKWLVTFAAWLFAVSTMISWSYYGEQGVVYLCGGVRQSAILIYKVIYCGLIVVTTTGFITTDAQLDMWTTLGLGVMLVANIPIMLLFGTQAMRAYHEYMGKLKRGEFREDEHAAPPIADVMEGKDVE